MFSSRLSAVAVIAALSLSFASCKKDDDKPTYGSASYNGKTTSFSAVDVDTDGGYTLTNATTLDSNATNATGVSVTLPSRPTVSKDYIISDSVSVGYLVVTADDIEVHSFMKAGEKVSASVTGGKVKLSFTSLTETDASGAAKSDGKPLSGSVSEK